MRHVGSSSAGGVLIKVASITTMIMKNSIKPLGSTSKRLHHHWKLKGLAAQRDQIETTLAQLCSCLHFMRESLRPGNEKDVLMMKSNTVNQVKELTTPFQPDMLEPNTKADVIFLALADLTTLCDRYGQVFHPGLLDPSKCHVTGNGADLEAALGKRSTAILKTIDFEGKPCTEPIKSLECELVPENVSMMAAAWREEDRASTRSATSPPSKGDTGCTSKPRANTLREAHLV